jgi:hypothetical protein
MGGPAAAPVLVGVCCYGTPYASACAHYYMALQDNHFVLLQVPSHFYNNFHQARFK